MFTILNQNWNYYFDCLIASIILLGFWFLFVWFKKIYWPMYLFFDITAWLEAHVSIWHALWHTGSGISCVQLAKMCWRNSNIQFYFL